MIRKVVYPGTFDPITLGHEDIVARSCQLFDQVIVAVACSKNKKTWLDFETRINMARCVFSGHPNVIVEGFETLLVHFLQKKNVFTVVRGLRAVSDFEYEFQLAGTNRRLLAEVETLFLVPSDDHQFISSSIVREVFCLHGDISNFVSQSIHIQLNNLFA